MLTVNELVLREQAAALNRINFQEDLLTFAFELRVVNATDKEGRFVVKTAKELANFENARKQITGEAKAEINKFKKLSDRAKWAREQALSELAGERRGSRGRNL